jgi:exopolyphosphatase/guanosine-5'-triphosphate,3'-diphosphate pyrophosphatase
MRLWTRPTALQKGQSGDVAVIDVGSNSVRMVVYALVGRVFLPKLNEKVMAGLGRGLQGTGKLSAEGVERAIDALLRFKAVLNALGVEQIAATATAAVRDAKDGPAFAARVKRETGIELNILAGEGEASMSAIGVCAGIEATDGVVADLGGSSLELIRVPIVQDRPGETFALGPLALDMGEKFEYTVIHARAKALLHSSKVLTEPSRNLYAVGGAWRALARVHMVERQYPLMVLQQYEIPSLEVLELCRRLGDTGKKSKLRIGLLAGKRTDTLPYAAAVLSALVESSSVSQVVISSYGLREGVLFQRLSATQQAADPLIEAMTAAFGADARQTAFGRALQAWVEPVLSATPSPLLPAQEVRLVAAATRLADIGATLHPDHRAEIAFELIVRGPYAGASHAERAFLAFSVARRYDREFEGGAIVQHLLPPAWRPRAVALGALMRLGSDVSARSAPLLQRCRLAVNKGELCLILSNQDKVLVSESVDKRLASAAEALVLKPRVLVD